MELVRGAGSESGPLPVGAQAIKNGHNLTTFMGAAPPVGTGRHRYFFVVYALDIDKVDVPEGTVATDLPVILQSHVLAWASLVPWYEQIA